MNCEADECGARNADMVVMAGPRGEYWISCRRCSRGVEDRWSLSAEIVAEVLRQRLRTRHERPWAARHDTRAERHESILELVEWLRGRRFLDAVAARKAVAS